MTRKAASAAVASARRTRAAAAKSAPAGAEQEGSLLVASAAPAASTRIGGREKGPLGGAAHDQFVKLGITREQDLVLHLPLRYEDHTRITPLRALLHGVVSQTEGVVMNSDVQYRPRRQLVALLGDPAAAGTTSRAGQLVLRFFHFYPSMQKTLARGKRVRVFGEVRDGYYGMEMVHPQLRTVEVDTPLPDRLTPVYPTTAGLSQETLRKLTARVMAATPALTFDTLPTWLVKQRRYLSFGEAVHFLHAPPPGLSEDTQRALDERTHPAWTRLKFDELVAQQLSLKAHRKARALKRAPVLTGTNALTGALLERLPFTLTGAQQRVWREIRADLARMTPMQRLLQGDVGSGKTVIAALAALQAIESGRQAAFMAPTEILAEQHYRKLLQWLADLPIEIAWLSGSLPAKQRRAALAAMASGDAMLAVGTHALFEDDVLLPRLGLLIVDEQHRFGVAQRLKLRGKATGEAHQLMMSATPIPRTLAMTFYADLDVSVLDEMPPGRSPVATRLVNQKRRAEVVERVAKACTEGRQAYWVCPLIEESEKLELQTAVALHAELTSTLSQFRVELLHGRMKPDAKAAVMAQFVAGEVHVLVATTVIEVGVNVPNATVMAIEHGERFGLAQLHQLRGRVGRGAAESTCFLLFEEPLSETAKARLKVIYENNDGFEIARQDLAIRGPGEFLGARQSGVPLLRFADLERDVALIEQARIAADLLLQKDPASADAHLARWLGGKEEFIKA